MRGRILTYDKSLPLVTTNTTYVKLFTMPIKVDGAIKPLPVDCIQFGVWQDLMTADDK